MLNNMVQSLHHSVLGRHPWLEEISKQNALPERLLIKPIDMWDGDQEIGKALSQGLFQLNGQSFQLHGECWEPPAIAEETLYKLHSFIWLRDLHAASSPASRQQARALIMSWIEACPKFERAPGAYEAMGERIAQWFSHHSHFTVDAPDHFDDIFFKAAVKQAQILVKYVTTPSRQKGFKSIKGALYSALCLPGFEAHLPIITNELSALIKEEFSEEGLHHTRNPQKTLDILADLLDMRSLLQMAAYQVPEIYLVMVPKMIGALKLLRFGDRKFTSVHGGYACSPKYIDAILAQAGMRAKTVKSLPRAGYTKLQQGRSAIIVDHGRSAAHIAPLSFEMAHGKERLFVNCGSHSHDNNWRHMLSGPHAHNCATIDMVHLSDDMNITLDHLHQEKEESYISVSHNGYLQETPFTQSRSIYMGQDGADIRGEDNWASELGLLKTYNATVRFHLDPRVIASLTQDHHMALLRLADGSGWQFRQTGAHMSLEESIYLGEENQPPRKTQQIVLRAPLHQQNTSIKWAVQKA